MKRRATGGQDHPQGLLDLKNEKDSIARHGHGCAKGGAGASAYLLGADEVVAEAASPSCASITTLMAFSVKRCRWRGGVRKGQKETSAAGQRHTCANGFSVEERPGEARPRGREPRGGSRGAAVRLHRADWTRESPVIPGRLSRKRGRRGG